MNFGEFIVIATQARWLYVARDVTVLCNCFCINDSAQ